MQDDYPDVDGDFAGLLLIVLGVVFGVLLLACCGSML